MQKSAVIEYKDDGYLCEGFAVWSDAGAMRPGILVSQNGVVWANRSTSAPICSPSLASTLSSSMFTERASARTRRKPAKPR